MSPRTSSQLGLFRLAPILLAWLVAPLPANASNLEIGTNDFHISENGWDGAVPVGVGTPAMVYNPLHEEYLVVWRVSRSSDPHGVFVQRLDARSGRQIGLDDLEIGTNAGAINSATVGYNRRRDQYLVVWTSIEPNGNEALYGQHLSGSTAQPIGEDDFLIAYGGTGQEGIGLHSHPALAYNAVDDEFLVAWASDAGVFQVHGEKEIFVRRIPGETGLPAGAAWRISAAEGYGDRDYQSLRPALAHDPVRNVYLVVWQGTTLEGREVYGQLLDGGTLVQRGADDGRISYTTALGGLEAVAPSVAYHAGRGEMVVAFASELVQTSWIEAQWVSAETGLPAGSPPVRVDLDAGTQRPQNPSVAIGADSHTALIAWRGWTPELVSQEREVLARFLASDGTLLSDQLRLSDVMGLGNADGLVANVHAAWAGADLGALVIWRGQEDGERYEVYGQRLAGPTLLSDGFESGGLDAWSAVVP